MKTTVKKTGRGILLTTLMVFGSIYSKAEAENKILEIVSNNMSGIYLISGVLGFAILLYIISKIASKYVKEDDTNPKFHQTIAHRHKHHHRVIKKSA
jgi:uncharacterized membrane protein YeaQ/YmgE (transglycosylase-associated protein family)